MNVVVEGKFANRTVKVVWSDVAPMQGPRDVLLAIVKRSSEIVGQEVGNPEVETVSFDYLRKDYGFGYVANQVLKEATFEKIDFEPKDPLISDGETSIVDAEYTET